MIDLEGILKDKEELEDRISDFINKEINDFQEKTGASARALECTLMEKTAIRGEDISFIFRVKARFALLKGRVFIK